jgi:hypothetical protein
MICVIVAVNKNFLTFRWKFSFGSATIDSFDPLGALALLATMVKVYSIVSMFGIFRSLFWKRRGQANQI